MAGQPSFKRRLLNLIQRGQRNINRGRRIPLGLIGPVLQFTCFPLSLPLGNFVVRHSLSFVNPVLDFSLCG